MKKIILGLFFICSVVDAGRPQLPNGEKTSPQKSAATTQAVTADDLIQMHRYFESAYYPLIKALREGGRIKRKGILSAYTGDPLLTRVHDGGHGTFIHTILPLKFGVIAHGSGDVNVDERRTHHANLQLYVDVIKLFLQSFLNVHEAIAKLDTMSPADWKQTYDTALNDAVIAFNAMTPADWTARIEAREKEFQEYSRD